MLLYDFGMKAGVEGLGSTIPFVLELAYLLLYAFPPAALLTLNLIQQRSRIGRYLFVLFLGTFTAYLLLPVWPVSSPRLAYPGVDLPLFEGFPRNINVWVLDHLDILTSVFPSGHVAVAMSNAFGLLVAVPSRHKIWGAAFGAAGLVYAATIYGRYHYAMDGLASIGIATAAWRVGAWLDARGKLS
jgi:membrane-associated phospholipid phosphatase